MPGITVKFKTGPVSHKAEQPVTGGQVVEAGTDPRSIVPATAESQTVLGVVLNDAAPYSEPAPGVMHALPEVVAVACSPAQVPVASDGSAEPGDVVVAGENGTVVKATEESTPAAIVGRVIEKLSGDQVSIRLYV